MTSLSINQKRCFPTLKHIIPSLSKRMGEYVGSSVYAELNLARGIGGDCESGLNQDGLEGYYRQFKDPPRLKTA